MLIFLLVFLCVMGPCVALVPSFSKLATQGLHVDLTSPSYHDGVLETNQGGIIRGKQLYLQAKQLRYINREEEGREVSKLEASGNLFFRFHEHIYVGDRIEFDLDSQTGTIYNVMTESGPWYISGTKLVMKADGSSVIYDCSVSMSENGNNDWSIHSGEVLLGKNATLRAKNVRFVVMHRPVLWWPNFTKNLSRTNRTPIKYRFRYNGKHGPRLGMSYAFETGENWENHLLLDVSLSRGLGGGFDMAYKNPEHPVEQFSAFNYYAYDIKTTDSDLNNRYRFQGKYVNKIFDDKVDFKAQYDRMSDSNFPSDFTSRGLDSGRASPTEMTFSKNEADWIASLNTKIRINDYQTVKQQLPLFQYSQRPRTFDNTGIVLENMFSAGYLDYLYAKETADATNFHSSRAELGQRVFRPYNGPGFVCTPYVGYRVIGYGSSPQNESRILAQAMTGFDLHTRLQREMGSDVHIVEPYVQYDYFTDPTVNPPKHFLFDLEDGLYRQNMVRFGARNFMRIAKSDGFLSQLNFDVYARAFIDSPAISRAVPRLYFDATYAPTAKMLYTIGSAWDTKRKNLDHFNIRSDVTLSENVAVALEYRHRNSYAWRKVDPCNFMLDTFRSEDELLHSVLSDKRDTFLAHLFMRVSPSLALELKSRHGWGRKHHKSFDEYECNFIIQVRQAFQITVNMQRRVEENRYGIYFSFGQKPPSGMANFSKIGQGNYAVP